MKRESAMKRRLIVLISYIAVAANMTAAAPGRSNSCNAVSGAQEVGTDKSKAAILYVTEPFEKVSTTLDAGISSFDVISSAQSVALGESFVANPEGLAAFKNNPAALIGIEGLNFYYNRRPMDWTGALEDAYYYSLGLLFDGSIGKFGIDYSRFDMDVTSDRTVYLPEGEGVLAQYYNHTITVTSAIDVYRGIVAGVNLKYFNFGQDYEEEPDYKPENKGAFIGDIGMLYKIRGFAGKESIRDFLRLGISLQNFGTDYKQKHDDEVEYHSAELPRYLRIGFSYELTNYLDPDSEFFRLLVTGEYRRLLNPDRYDEGEENYGGIGFEYTLFEILSLRIGGIIQPNRNIYGYEDRLMMRYGFGVNLPFERFNSKYPLALSFDYANIPLYEPGFPFGLDKESFSVFTVALKYEESIF